MDSLLSSLDSFLNDGDRQWKPTRVDPERRYGVEAWSRYPTETALWPHARVLKSNTLKEIHLFVLSLLLALSMSALSLKTKSFGVMYDAPWSD